MTYERNCGFSYNEGMGVDLPRIEMVLKLKFNEMLLTVIHISYSLFEFFCRH